MKTKKKLIGRIVSKVIPIPRHSSDFFTFSPLDNEDTESYEGVEEEARRAFEKDIEGTEEANCNANFAVFCSNNLVEHKL